jgi:hypothetical protein
MLGMHQVLNIVFIRANFNHERWAIICGIIAGSRHVLEETFKWANQRVVFGKKLSAQPVVRAKLANMVHNFFMVAFVIFSHMNANCYFI